MRHRTKFREGRSNRSGDMADFRFFKMAAAAILDVGCHRAKFRQDRPNRCGDIANFLFLKMAAAAILDFKKIKFLTVGTLKRLELRLPAKCCRNRSNRG